MDVAALRIEGRAHEAARDLAAASRVYRDIVQQDPAQLDVWLRLSALEQLRGHYREAAACASAAAAALGASARWARLGQVSRRLLLFDEPIAMQSLIRQAPWDTEEVLSQAALLSQQLWLTHAFDDALRLIDLALARRASPALLYSRALALAHCGRMPEATAAYEACIALAPGHADAHWSLAHHVRTPTPFARVARIRRARERFDPAAVEQAYLCNALFKELDDGGDRDGAWAALEECNAIKRALVRHDGRRARAALDATRRIIGGDFVAGGGGSTGDGEPIFIVGMPRTGTTVLERMLGRHSRVATGGELNALSSALRVGADAFVGIPPSGDDIAGLAGADLRLVGDEYLRRTRPLYGQREMLVDKNPLNIAFAGIAARALPRARFLCLVRDPMDACFSNYKALFSGDAYGYSYTFAELAAEHARFTALVAHWQAAMPDRFVVVGYEALVTDPATAARRVLAACGLDFEPACVDIAGNPLPVSSASSVQVRQPIHRGGIGAWRRYAQPLAPLARLIATGSGLASTIGSKPC